MPVSRKKLAAALEASNGNVVEAMLAVGGYPRQIGKKRKPARRKPLAVRKEK